MRWYATLDNYYTMDDPVLSTYRSAKELQNHSLEDFGFKSSEERLRHAAKYYKIYKGYKIRYTKDLMEVS